MPINPTVSTTINGKQWNRIGCCFFFSIKKTFFSTNNEEVLSMSFLIYCKLLNY